MSAAYVIETGHPTPTNPTRGMVSPEVDALRRLAKANVGDSVFLPGKTTPKVGRLAVMRVGPGWFSSRAVPGGVRVWKVCEPGESRPAAPATEITTYACRTPETCASLGCISGMCP